MIEMMTEEEKREYWEWFRRRVNEGDKDALETEKFLKSIFPNDIDKQKKLLFVVEEIYETTGGCFDLYVLYKVLHKYGIESKFKEIVENWVRQRAVYGE